MTFPLYIISRSLVTNPVYYTHFLPEITSCAILFGVGFLSRGALLLYKPICRPSLRYPESTKCENMWAEDGRQLGLHWGNGLFEV